MAKRKSNKLDSMYLQSGIIIKVEDKHISPLIVNIDCGEAIDILKIVLKDWVNQAIVQKNKVN